MSKDFLDKIVCKNGIFNILKNDSYICKSLLEYGEWSELEIDLYKDIIKINDIIIEVGSHIGSHAIPLAKIVKEGYIYAYEPQLLLFDLLNNNIKHNDISNIKTYLEAVSSHEKKAKLNQVDYQLIYENKDEVNSGGLDFKELISENGSYEINIITLDNKYKHLQKLDFIKIDAEGNEFDILKGSKDLLKKFNPIIYCEFHPNQIKEKNKILNFLKNFDYIFYDHMTPLFNINNFKENKLNIFRNIFSAMFLAFPKKKMNLDNDLILAKHSCKEIDIKTLNLDQIESDYGTS
jgi:FkbM family methyltransferase